MIGQHPQMYALPELHLFSAETVADWWELCDTESFEMDHGLVRTIAELYFGEQTDRAASRARGWLRRRSHFTTGLLLEVIMDRLTPLIPVEKSPSIVYSAEALQRIVYMFPTARFLHLVSHPRLYGESVVQALRELTRDQPLAQSHWLMRLASYPPPAEKHSDNANIMDPQVGWYTLNMAITTFLSTVPKEQQMTIRGEDLVVDADEGLRSVATWLGIRTDSEAVAEMKHPERSPYACLGPSSASYGSDIFLLGIPLIRPEWMPSRSLEGPVGWRTDGGEFSPELKRFAQRLGYS
jgi:Sulfotransferase family